ncbi:Sir2 family NAD-dependent protein deacetylase [Marispirochaeta aestuarii]|uniref:SIR2 family NAD-dependent protein deacylase n=1 Tax=Marispirochaeta aestuarii TaxID=1963862 RepID=UPI0029C81E5A|nr:Sir2 family NAD-dependent protein deacetylase [Marispirochaeta aestuarii]
MNEGIVFEPHFIDLMKSSTRILVVTGAGISTSAGIIDFRSPGGLYEVAVHRYELPYPEAIFDINYFKRNPEPFFKLSAELLLADIEPSLCHRFLAALETNGQILHIITQNIDMLHEKAGSRNVVEGHGSYRSGRCISCEEIYQFDDFSADLLRGEVPHCSICGGVIKPDVVFFGELLTDSFMKIYHNRPRADLLLVLGTSLTVHPIAGFALDYAPRIPSVLVTRDPTSYDRDFDYVFHCALDDFARELWEVLDV